jgi:CheY-like chemotaxis protein
MDNPCPTVLVVDDEADVREFARRVLESQGFEVLMAKNGVEALLLGEHHHGFIHALVTDLMMPPYMGGCELAQALRRIRPGMAVLYISGYPADAVVQSEVLEEAAGFLAKPFKPDVLVRRVRELIRSAAESESRRSVSGPKQEKAVLVLVPDEELRNGIIASMLRTESPHVLEARNIGEALALCQWYAGRIGLLLADRETLSSLPLELSERLLQARPEMRILCASASVRDGEPVADLIRRVIEEWGLEVAGEE